MKLFSRLFILTTFINSVVLSSGYAAVSSAMPVPQSLNVVGMMCGHNQVDIMLGDKATVVVEQQLPRKASSGVKTLLGTASMLLDVSRLAMLFTSQDHITPTDDTHTIVTNPKSATQTFVQAYVIHKETYLLQSIKESWMHIVHALYVARSLCAAQTVDSHAPPITITDSRRDSSRMHIFSVQQKGASDEDAIANTIIET